MSICLAVDCNDPRMRNKKWCKGHNRTFEGMMYQAEISDDPEGLEIWIELYKDDHKVAMAAVVTLALVTWCSKQAQTCATTL